MDVYEIMKTIGSGSFGQVYMARHSRENKHYVIKRVKTRDMSQKDLENTENEVRLLQKIRHTNIVAYKDSYVDREQYLNIVMVYCDGGDIYSKIKSAKGKNFPETQIIDWLVQMALALLYLHERKILHRDMKTQNIFLKNGKIRLGDFGIAKVLDSTRDFANTCIGTPYYMSPELFKNQPYSYKSDVWALGCVLYEMCNLRHAFDAQSINGLAVKILRGSFPPVNKQYSKQLRDLIDKMLQVKPKARPTILDILNKVFVRKRATGYFNECLMSPPPALSPTDVDDMYVDSLKDQAEKLMIPGYGNDNSAGSRLASGGRAPQGVINKRNPKKPRDASSSKSPEKIQRLKNNEEKKKELLRLKNELKDKEDMENKLKELEQDAKEKETFYREKYQRADKRRNDQIQDKKDRAVRGANPYAGLRPEGARSSANRSSSVPASSKHSNNIQQVNKSIQGLAGTGVMPGGAPQPEQRDARAKRSPKAQKRGRSDISIEDDAEEVKYQKPGRGRQHASSMHEDDSQDEINLLPGGKRGGSLIKEESKGGEGQLLKNSRNNQNVSSQNSLTDGPLNTYAEFKKVFDAKNVGQKTNRRQAQAAQSSLQDSQVRHKRDAGYEAEHRLLQGSSQSVTQSAEIGNAAQFQGDGGPMSAREKILHDKEQKKLAAENHRSRELDRIRLENLAVRQEAHHKNYNQYRTSYDQSLSKSGSNLSIGSGNGAGGAATRSYEPQQQDMVSLMPPSPGMGSIQASQKKKIQENFQLFDEDHVQDPADGDLEDIIEEVIEEESDDEEDNIDDPNGDIALASQELKDQKRANREELRMLRTQLLTMKEQIAEKTQNIEQIRTNLKKNKVQVPTRASGETTAFMDVEGADDDAIDQTVREMDDEAFLLEDETAPTGDSIDEGDNDNEEDYGAEQRGHFQVLNEDESPEEEAEEMQMPETDPQILKLTDKVRLYKHRCVASLGYNLYEKAFDFLKSTVARGVQTEERRSGLVGILGQESIGFWAILDQILFYEELVRELQTDAQQRQQQLQMAL